MSASSELSLEEVQTWKVDALKVFCRKRNLKVTGTKAELVARVFAASEMGIHEEPTATELVSRTELEKAKLLLTPNNTQLKDPLSPKDNWLREQDGLTSWPPIFLSDITIYYYNLYGRSPGKGCRITYTSSERVQGRQSISFVRLWVLERSTLPSYSV